MTIVTIKKCPNYPGYSAGSDGSIYTHWFIVNNDITGYIKGKAIDYSRRRLLSTQYKQEPNRDQIRPHVVIRQNGKRKKVLVSRMVADAHVPNPLGFKSVRHINDISTMNNADNLIWGTSKMNAQDRERNQTNDCQVATLQKKIDILQKLLQSYAKEELDVAQK